MFQTEPILALQAIPGDLFRLFMLFVSQLGAPAFGFVLALFLLNVDLRRGFLLTQVLAVTAIVTTLLKKVFALPRPLYVDSHVAFIEDGAGYPTSFAGMGADGFFAALPRAVVDAHRALPDPSWGFPSGHVSATAALCVALVLLYRRRGLLLPALLFVAAVATARLYLGKHFLADVLAGALLGALIALLGHALASREVGAEGEQAAGRPAMLLRYGYLVVLPLALMLTPFGETSWYSSLLGVNLGYLALRALKIRSSDAAWRHRAFRVAIAASMMIALVPLAMSLAVTTAATQAVAYGIMCLAVVLAPGMLAGWITGPRR